MKFGQSSIRSESVAENKVKDLVGRDIGRIEQVLVNSQSGRPEFALISFGSFLGATDRLFAVPWDTLELDESGGVYYLSVDGPTLRAAPKFHRAHRSRLSPEYLRRVRDHFQRGANAQQEDFGCGVPASA